MATQRTNRSAKQAIITILLIFACILILNACIPQVRPNAPRDSEVRMLQRERVQSFSSNPLAELTPARFFQLWNDSQAELNLRLPVTDQGELSTYGFRFICDSESVSGALTSVELRASPKSVQAKYTLLNAWSLLLAISQSSGGSLQDSLDEANQTLHRLGVKPNSVHSKAPLTSSDFLMLPLRHGSLTLHHESGEYRLRINWATIEPVQAGLSTPYDSPAVNRLNLSYLYFGSPATYVSQIDKTGNTLNVVSPNYFDIMSGGQLDVTWKLDSNFITTMKQRGIKVVPFLSNHWDRQNGIDALTRSDLLVAEIAAAVERYELDGVHIDIEGVGAAYRNAFSEFVRKMRASIPASKEVSVAVAANPNGWTTGWHGFYDYRALSETADYLMVMSYDESWEGSDPGPVSSFSFFERSLTYALGQGVPASKLVMGVPFYGRLWKLTGDSTDQIRGIGVSNSTGVTLLSRYGGETIYDQQSQTPYALFEIPNGEGRYIAGKWCDSGNYILWHENEQSLKKKLRLIARSGIHGVGSWSLYQEAPGTWAYFAQWLNGVAYRDVPSGFWAEADILRMEEKGWMTGMTSTEFAPQKSLTRAEGAVILARALGLTAAPINAVFADVPTHHWAAAWIEAAYQAGLVSGMGASATGKPNYAPDAQLTREQLSVLLNRALQGTSPTTPDTGSALTSAQVFTDVPLSRWSAGAVMSLYQSGIVKGLEANRFGVSQPSTRAQMAALMSRISGQI